MRQVSDSVERKICELMPNARHVREGESTVYLLDYMNNHFVRYVEGGKHLTCDCRIENLPSSLINWLPAVARILFGPKLYIVELKSPIAWDNETQVIPVEKVRDIGFRIKRAAEQKYRECRVEIDGQTLQA
jgi:hypothetical protein